MLIVVAFVDVYKLIYHFFHYKILFTSIFWLFPGFCKKTVCSARLLYLAVRKWQNGNLERKIWAFSQKMRWLFWLFWLFQSITHTTGFFPPKKPGFFGLFRLFRAFSAFLCSVRVKMANLYVYTWLAFCRLDVPSWQLHFNPNPNPNPKHHI